MKKTTFTLLSFMAVLVVACSENSVKSTKKEATVALISDTGKNSKAHSAQIKIPQEQQGAVTPATPTPTTPQKEVINHNKVEKTEAVYTGLLDDDKSSATAEQKKTAIQARGVWWNAPSQDFKKAIVAGINHKFNVGPRSSEPTPNAVDCGYKESDDATSNLVNCLPTNAALNDAQIKYILKFQGVIPIVNAINLDTLATEDLKVLRSMTKIQLLGFASQTSKGEGLKGNITGKFSQRIVNYLPPQLKGLYIDGIEFTATDLTNVTSLISVNIPTGDDKNPYITSKVGVTLPPGAGFNNTVFPDSED